MGKEVMARFPLAGLFFIIASGFLVVVLFPMNALNFTLQNFYPFANLVNLTDNNFLVRITEMFLASLFVGGVIFMLYGAFEHVNHFFGKKLHISTKEGKEPKERYTFQKNLGEKYPEFNKWMIHNGTYRGLEFIDVISEVSTAFLYASESLFLITLILGFGFILQPTLWTLFYIFQWFLPFIVSLLIMGGFIIVYKTNKKRQNALHMECENRFKEWEQYSKSNSKDYSI
jgi:hypothetical protein